MACLLPLLHLLPVLFALPLAAAGPASKSEPAPAPPARERVVVAEQRALQAVLESVVAQEQGAFLPDRNHPPHVAVVVVDTRTGARAAVDGGRPVYLASGVKLFVLFELYRQRHAGTLSFDEEIPYTINDVRDGAPTMNRQPIGARYTVRQLIKWMVRDSDNAAFDLLLRRAGSTAVDATVRRFGPAGPVASTLEARRTVYGELDARARSLSPVAVRDVRWRDGWHPRLDLLKKHIGPPFGRYDDDDLDAAWADWYKTGASSAPLSTVTAALLALHDGAVVGPREDAEMLALLRDVSTSDRRIEGDLPNDAIVAHKTGSLHKRLCDLGLVTLPDGSDIVVVVAVAGAGVERAEAAVARVSRAAWDVVIESRSIEPALPSPTGDTAGR